MAWQYNKIRSQDSGHPAVQNVMAGNGQRKEGLEVTRVKVARFEVARFEVTKSGLRKLHWFGFS
jgi:hypothetical protein